MGVISLQQFTFRLVANGQQLDIFKNEEILLSNNVTGLFDIGVIPADFTRQITLPGTKVNNAFFEHVYDISIQNPFLFATNVKVPCYLDFGGIYLSQGYLQLNKVNVIANKFVDSYEVSIFGATSSFSRDVNKLFLTDLSVLAKYNHTSSYDNIVNSWDGNLFSGSIVYPMADYGTGWTFTQGDDFFGVDDALGAMTVQDFKPAIRVKAVLDGIFEQTGYTYSSSFFNQDWINDMYMVCNHSLQYPIYSDVNLEGYGVVKIGAISGSGMTDLNVPNATWTTLPWFNNLEDPQAFMGQNASYLVEVSSSFNGILNLNFNVSSSVGNLPSQFNLKMIETGSGYNTYTTLVNFNNYFSQYAQSRSSTQGIDQDFELSTAFYITEVPPGNYQFQIEVLKYYTSTAPKITIDPKSTTKSYLQIKKVRQAADNKVLDIPSNMPYGTKGIKLVDFISGLQKKFHLVMYPDNTQQNHFIIETFNNWYTKGQVKDFNKYINLDLPIEVIPANNFAVNNLNFGDTLDTDYISQQFFKGANREYGKTYYVDTQNFFSQGTLEVKTTFASDPLIKIAGTGLSGSAGGITPPISQYSAGTYFFTNQNGAQYACSTSTQIQIYTADGNLTSGQTAYLDQYGNTPLTGYYYFSNGTQIYQINHSTGQIGTVVALCRR